MRRLPFFVFAMVQTFFQPSRARMRSVKMVNGLWLMVGDGKGGGENSEVGGIRLRGRTPKC